MPGSRGVANGSHRIAEKGTFIVGTSGARTIWIRLAVDQLTMLNPIQDGVLYLLIVRGYGRGLLK